MKLATKVVAAACTATLMSGSPLLAGDGKTFKEKVIVEEPTSWWNAALSTGWDSSYMFRGVNVLPGAGLYWTQLSATAHITKNDNLTLAPWMAFGIGNLKTGGATSYKELDLPVNYTHTFGNLTLGAGYTLYTYFNYLPGGNGYQNELNVSAAYAIKLGAVTLTPSLTYYYELGPSVGSTHGVTYGGSSYLAPTLTLNVPVYKDIITFDPNTTFGFNFRYNATAKTDPVSPFNGGNNWQIILPLTWHVNKIISVSGYGAYSTQWNGLVGTSPNWFWGGANVTFSF